jgi:hypothetical protein
MLHTRKVALLVSIVVLTLGVAQYSSATIDIVGSATPGFTLVKADWCNDECDEQCGSAGCATAWSEGCSCYWFCRDGEDGVSICTSPMPLKICAN